MAELHGNRDWRMRSDGSQDPGECGLVLVGVEAQILRGDPPLGGDRRGFKDHEPRPGESQVAEVDHVPVASRTVRGRILAHRRDHDPVPQAKIPDQKRLEQAAHQVLLKSGRGRGDG